MNRTFNIAAGLLLGPIVPSSLTFIDLFTFVRVLGWK